MAASWEYGELVDEIAKVQQGGAVQFERTAVFKTPVGATQMPQEDTIAVLQVLGADGWEMVAAFETGSANPEEGRATASRNFYFKRPTA